MRRLRAAARVVLLGRGRIALALLGAACTNMGPDTVPRDRFEYSQAIAESWMRQNLLNIVKLRYMAPPIFVDVASIVSGYQLESAVAGGVAGGNGAIDESLNLGASVKYTDRPTITYTPLTGSKFVKALMTPIRPESLFFTLQAGWPADVMLGIGLNSINGLDNRKTSLAGETAAESGFLRVIELLRQVQLSGALGMRIVEDPQKAQSTVVVFRSAVAAPEVADHLDELRRLLRLSPDANEYRLVFGAVPLDDRELAVQTRSLLQIMASMAANVEVPEQDIADGRATPGAAEGGARPASIKCASERPADAFVTVRYRDHWFYIDDRDLRAKRAFTFLMLLFTLADTGERENLPVLTIPAN